MKRCEIQYSVGRHNWVDKRQCSGKESACQCSRHKRKGFDLQVGKITRSRKWPPTPVILSGKFNGQRSPVGYSLCGCKEQDKTEYACARFHTHTHTHFIRHLKVNQRQKQNAVEKDSLKIFKIKAAKIILIEM